MRVCVTEKPSVARDIARLLGANNRHEGYFEGNGYQVTWTFGHLCALFDPHEYDPQWKGWHLSSLPMIPRRFAIKVSGDEGVHKQFNILKNLIAQATEVINCGDAGQEGELIQRWVYQKAGCKVPVKRLWVSSLTEDAIREAFAHLKDQSAYQHLYEAGLMRAIGDWLLGMNATRAYTLRYAEGQGRDRQILSIGRVQTPTLALVVKRQEEIEHFRPRTYWELKTKYRDTLFSAQLPAEEDDYAIKTAEDGQQWLNKITGKPFVITSVEKKKGKESAPRLFDLTSLQVACNKKYGFSAERTLQLIQSLYEKRLTTYPRVDTTYLSDDLYPKIPATLQGIKDFYPQTTPLLTLKADGKNTKGSLPKFKKVFDNKKVTDHHAIIPTGQRPDCMDADEKKVYDLVALHFIANFYPDCEVSQTVVLGAVEDVTFKVTGKEILSAGWRVVFPKDADDSSDGKKEESEKVLPTFVKGESGEHTPQLIERTTTPPKYYTEATLLRAMETAGKTVDDEDLRDALKENGIGRPSTRAAIIEKLFQRNYIVRERKSIRATETGIRLIHTIISPLLKSAELTGRWEKKLREIERGEFEAAEFLNELKQMTGDVVMEVKTNKAGMLCPVCHKGVIIRGKTRYGCSRWKEGCSYAEPF